MEWTVNSTTRRNNSIRHIHRVDHKMTRELTYTLNTSSSSIPISKNTFIGTVTQATKVENVCSINWSTLDEAGTEAAKQVADLSETKGLVKKLLPEIPHETVTPDADIPEEARSRLKELLETKYTSIILQSTTDYQ